MLRRGAAYIILTTVLLHGSARLGLLDHVYQKRHEIAFALSLISEVPIAICSVDYDFAETLKIESGDDSHSGPPVSLQTNEVDLFLIEQTEFDNQSNLPASIWTRITADLYRLAPSNSIFHPPIG